MRNIWDIIIQKNTHKYMIKHTVLASNPSFSAKMYKPYKCLNIKCLCGFLVFL